MKIQALIVTFTMAAALGSARLSGAQGFEWAGPTSAQTIREAAAAARAAAVDAREALAIAGIAHGWNRTAIATSKPPRRSRRKARRSARKIRSQPSATAEGTTTNRGSP